MSLPVPHVPDIRQCVSAMFDSLREMNVERFNTEVPLTKQLASILREKKGYPAKATKYDNTKRDKCDLVINFSDNCKFWVEAKLAWKDWPSLQTSTKFDAWYYHKQLLSPVEGTVKDVRRLRNVPATSATYLGILIVGFDSFRHPLDGDITEMLWAAGMEAEPWACSYVDWRHPKGIGHRIRCWLWHRPADVAFASTTP
jgi:hypothetical protein